MAMEDDILSDLADNNQKAIEAFRRELGRLRTGRASVSLLDSVRVSYYGTPTPLNQCASLSVPDARMIFVKPFDKSLLPEIEKAILNADIGINPQSDGEVIRLPIPPLNEERRKELFKQARNRGEDAKIGIRNHRRDANEMLKEFEKDKEISQDDLKRALEKVQARTNEAIEEVERVLGQKEKEILEV